MTRQPDQKLVEEYRAGDVGALAELVERYRKPLCAFVFNMTGRPDMVDDVFQEVWIRVIRKIRAYRSGNFHGWLMRIAHNIAIDGIRRDRRNVSLEEERRDGRNLLNSLPSRAHGPDRRAEAKDVGDQIAEAVQQLPPEQKEVFLLRAQSGLPFKEIARIQGVSINTALARMQYALAKLRGTLKTYDPEKEK